MRAIHCAGSEANGGRGHFLARLNGDKLELWCAKCKMFHAVAVVDLVRGMVADLQSGAGDVEQPDGLLW